MHVDEARPDEAAPEVARGAAMRAGRRHCGDAAVFDRDVAETVPLRQARAGEQMPGRYGASPYFRLTNSSVYARR